MSVKQVVPFPKGLPIGDIIAPLYPAARTGFPQMLRRYWPSGYKSFVSQNYQVSRPTWLPVRQT